jgi:hypothetical protein
MRPYILAIGFAQSNSAITASSKRERISSAASSSQPPRIDCFPTHRWLLSARLSHAATIAASTELRAK